jgi:uncharacterized protein YecE (DUF72 family)
MEGISPAQMRPLQPKILLFQLPQSLQPSELYALLEILERFAKRLLPVSRPGIGQSIVKVGPLSGTDRGRFSEAEFSLRISR